MKFWIYTFLGILVAKNAFAAPDMLSVSIGGEFPDKPKAPFNLIDTGKPRPTIQFRVPNSGETEVLFPEYEVVILRSTSEISIITGRRVFTDGRSCEKNKEIAFKWVKKIIPNSKRPQRSTNLFSSDANNITARLACVTDSDSPYPILELQFRGKVQDEKLKAAWAEYFKNQS